MAEQGSTLSYRVPCKSCHGAIIPYKKLSIQLKVDWAINGGDDPDLVIDITDTEPPTVPLQRNQSSVFLNSVHHQQFLHQDGCGPTFRQENFFCHQQRNLLTVNERTLSNHTVMNNPVNHHDVSMSSIRMPSKKDEAIEKIVNHLKSPDPSSYHSASTIHHPSPSFPQPRLQTPSFSVTDFQSNMPMPTINWPANMKSISHMTDFAVDHSSNPSWHCPPSRPIVCPCKNAPNIHDPNCPLITMSTQNGIMPPPSVHRSSNDQNGTFSFQTYTNVAGLQSPGIEPTITTGFTSVPNLNSMRTGDLPAIKSQPSSIIHYTGSSSTVIPSLFDVGRCSEQSLVHSRPITTDANQFNYTSNSELSTPMIEQQATKSSTVRQPKKRLGRPKSIKNTDQLLLNDPNQLKQQVVILDNGSFPLQDEVASSSRPPSTPSRTEREIKIVLDDNMIASRLSTDSVLCSSISDSNENSTQQQQSPQKLGTVRSPVKLDIVISQTTDTTESISAIVNKTVAEVAHGAGKVPSTNTSTSPSSQFQQHQKKRRLPDQQSWQLDFRAKTDLSPFPIYRPPQLSVSNSTMSTSAPLLFQSAIENQNVSNRSFSPPNLTKREKQVKPKSTIHPPKRSRKNSVPTTQSTVVVSPEHSKTAQRITATSLTSPPQSDFSRTALTPSIATIPSLRSDALQPVIPDRTSSVTSMSRSGNQSVAWFGTPVPLESLGCDTVSPSLSRPVASAPLENANADSASDIWVMSNSDDSARSDYFANEQEEQFMDFNSYESLQLDHNDDFPSKIDTPLTSTTLTLPILPISTPITSQLLTPVSTDKPPSASTTSTINSYDNYEELDYSTHYPSPSQWEVNLTLSSALTPIDFLTHSPSDQPHQHQLRTDTYSDGSLQPQISTSNSNEIDSRTSQQMNEQEETKPLTTSKPKQKPLKKLQPQPNGMKTSSKKLSKRPNRSNHPPKVACTRCGVAGLVDITQHEFPKQKGLVFECTSCGNNSIRSNVSADEHRRRLLKVAADHLRMIKCQFCDRNYHSHNEYLSHLKDDHGSNKAK